MIRRYNHKSRNASNSYSTSNEMSERNETRQTISLTNVTKSKGMERYVGEFNVRRHRRSLEFIREEPGTESPVHMHDSMRGEKLADEHSENMEFGNRHNPRPVNSSNEDRKCPIAGSAKATEDVEHLLNPFPGEQESQQRRRFFKRPCQKLGTRSTSTSSEDVGNLNYIQGKISYGQESVTKDHTQTHSPESPPKSGTNHLPMFPKRGMDDTPGSREFSTSANFCFPDSSSALVDPPHDALAAITNCSFSDYLSKQMYQLEDDSFWDFIHEADGYADDEKEDFGDEKNHNIGDKSIILEPCSSLEPMDVVDADSIEQEEFPGLNRQRSEPASFEHVDDASLKGESTTGRIPCSYMRRICLVKVKRSKSRRDKDVGIMEVPDTMLMVRRKRLNSQDDSLSPPSKWIILDRNKSNE